MDQSLIQTPLIAAIVKQDEVTVKQLLAAETNPASAVNTKDEDGRTALWHAASHDNAALVKLLLSVDGIEIDSRDDNNWSPLTVAITREPPAPSIVDLLLDTNAFDINTKTTDAGRSPLSYAAGNGNISLVKRLLAIPGIDVNNPDGDNWTPLTYAVTHYHTEIAKLLLSTKDIDPDPRDVLGWTPLCFVCDQGNHEMVRALLATGKVDVTVMTEEEGHTPLHLAAQAGCPEAVVMLLATGKMDWKAEDEYGHTAADLAQYGGCDDHVRGILSGWALAKGERISGLSWWPED